MHRLVKGFLGALLVPLALFAQTGAKPTNVHVSAGLTAHTLTCTTTLASPSTSAVQTSITAAADGAVICITGNPTWSGGAIHPLTTKAVTLACKPTTTCNIAASGTVFSLPSSGDSSKLFRISGFNFTFTGGGFFFWSCTPGGCTNTWSNFRFDHNTVTCDNNQCIVLFIGENGAQQYVYGVADHNTWTAGVSSGFLNWIDATDSTPPSPPMGTANNFFLEDNNFTITNIDNLGEGCTDGWGQMPMVYRHNTSLNCRIITHGVTHGSGPSNFEVYNNTIVSNDVDGQGCYRCIHHQGSNTFIIANNTFTTNQSKDPDPIALLHYRDYWFGSMGPGSAGFSIDSGLSPCDGTQSRDGNRTPTSTWYGYPCYRQPGRDEAGTYKPVYVWNNKWSDTGARIDLSFDSQGGTNPPSCTASSGGTCNYDTIHMQANREWFNSVSINAQTSATSPFNGTTGMGFGTLANRPTTCTTSSESALGAGAAGVGYFATDSGTQGTLYTCSATNTWTAYWTPYTYPHPLTLQ